MDEEIEKSKRRSIWANGPDPDRTEENQIENTEGYRLTPAWVEEKANDPEYIEQSNKEALIFLGELALWIIFAALCYGIWKVVTLIF